MKISRFIHSTKVSVQLILLLAIVALSFSPIGVKPAFAAPPGNDNFTSATLFTTVPYTDTVTTTDATTEANEKGPGEAPYSRLCDNKFLRLGTRTIWYRFVPASSGLYSVDTLGTNYDDTYLAIWSGSTLQNLTLLACDDDNEVGFTSQLSYNFVAGNTYYIQIAKYNGTITGSPDSSACGGVGGTCTAVLHVRNQIFADVPPTHPYFDYIEALYTAGLTGGCGTNPLIFCPSLAMNRAQMAVFTMRGEFGSGYTPPPPPYAFRDNWANAPWAESWANGMLQANLTGGCATSPQLLFCPYDQTTKEQAAVFALRLKHGSGYAPPAASGTVFADMTNPSHWSIPWTEQAYAEGLIPSCGMSGGQPLYCPTALVDRGFGAYIIAKAKGLVP